MSGPKKDYSPYRDSDFVNFRQRMEGRNERIVEHAGAVYHCVVLSYLARVKALKVVSTRAYDPSRVLIEENIVIPIKDILPLIRVIEHGK